MMILSLNLLLFISNINRNQHIYDGKKIVRLVIKKKNLQINHFEPRRMKL